MKFVTPRNIILAIVAIIGLSVVAGSWYTVNDREAGVVLRNGKVLSIAEPGLNFKVPFIDSVVLISTQNQSIIYNAIPAYSFDQQTAVIRVSVSYHVEMKDVAEVYSKYSSLDGLVERVFSRQLPTQVENVFGKYTAANAVKNREKFNADISAAFRSSSVGPFVVDSLQIENIDFDDSYETNIRTLMAEEVSAATAKNTTVKKLEANKQMVNEATAKAESELAIATAKAQAVRLQGDAEAHAIRAKAEALEANQGLIDLTKAERWNGQLPTHMIPGSAVPFMTLK